MHGGGLLHVIFRSHCHTSPLGRRFAAFAFVALLTNGARGGNERTILAGVAASQLFNAITAYTISTSASAQQARDVMFWLLGSFSGVRWPEFQLVIVKKLWRARWNWA